MSRWARTCAARLFAEVSRLPRSYLYVPGDRHGWVGKALAGPADAVIADLEDSVIPERKDAAREAVSTMTAGPLADPLHRLWVRLDGAHLERDIDAVVGPALAGVVVPGADVERLARVDRALASAEEEHGVPTGSTPVIGLIETAAAVLSLAAVATAPRLLRLGIGEADLAGELGLQPDELRTELWPIRSAVVVASAAAGLAAPIGPVETRLGDETRLVDSTRRQLRQGFRARTAIHPGQLEVINEVFTPSGEEVDRAAAVVVAFEAAVASGTGAVRGPRGELLDPATVRWARDVMDRAR